IEKVCLLNVDHAGRPNGDSQVIRLLFRLDPHQLQSARIEGLGQSRRSRGNEQQAKNGRNRYR
ncbi:MAG TPA: hypothetical protein DCE39_12630, partial [Planctomycetaceae bacterium]|nr:hypothetical protein [Planctomycetaceae bacterium]